MRPGHDSKQENSKGRQECSMADRGAEAEDRDRKVGRCTVLLISYVRSFVRYRHGAIRLAL